MAECKTLIYRGDPEMIELMKEANELMDKLEAVQNRLKNEFGIFPPAKMEQNQ